MKKLSIILLSIILCISFCACSNSKTEDNASTTTTAVGASTARPNDDAQSTENASTTDVGASTANQGKGDVIQSNTTTTSKNNGSNQNPTEQDNVRVNAEELVGGNYFD